MPKSILLDIYINELPFTDNKRFLFAAQIFNKCVSFAELVDGHVHHKRLQWTSETGL